MYSAAIYLDLTTEFPVIHQNRQNRISCYLSEQDFLLFIRTDDGSFTTEVMTWFLYSGHIIFRRDDMVSLLCHSDVNPALEERAG